MSTSCTRFVWLPVILCLSLVAFFTGCEDSGESLGGGGGVLKGSAVVIYAGAKTNIDAAVTCLFLPYECVEDHVTIIDAVRDGNTIYVIANIGSAYFPGLFISSDRGDTWTSHPLPPSYDVVEGIEDQTPGRYLLYPWQGRLFMLVEANTFTANYAYWAISEVNLETNTYALKSNSLGAGAVHFADGVALQATTDGNGVFGDIYWRRYDFVTDTMLAQGSMALAGTNTHPERWISPDGVRFLAVGTRQTTGTEICMHWINTVIDGNAFTTVCLPSLLSPLQAPQDAFPVPLGDTVGWLTEVAGHALVVRFEAVEGVAVPDVIDLGPGGRDRNFSQPGRARFGDFLVMAQPSADDIAAPAGGGRLLRVRSTGVEDVTMPRTPCDSDSICGFGDTGFGYGKVQWMVPLDNGEVLVLHVVNQVTDGNRQLLVATRERPTFKPADITPLELGPLPGLPGAQEGSAFEQQCFRALACGFHRNFESCRLHWREVRPGAQGTDPEFAAFLAVPAAPEGTCADFQAAYNDRREPGVPCVPGCEDGWATYDCATRSSDMLVLRTRCEAKGTTCQTDTEGRGYCGARELGPQDCNTCDGEVAISCFSQPWPMATDCATLGMTCHVDADTGAYCSPGTCAGDRFNECDGEVEQYCSPSDNSILTQFDCARFGDGHCADAGPCQVYGEGCATIGFGHQCESGLLIYCDGGSDIRFVDCRDLGFSGCKTTPDGPNLALGACVP